MNGSRFPAEQPASDLGNGQPAHVLRRNIEAILEARKKADQQGTWADHLADAMTAFSGSMFFVLLHLIWFGVWIVANLGWFGWPAFDPFPYGLLTTIVSLEAIFLSTFVLVSQNRQAKISDRHAELNLQVDLLAEREDTKILRLVTAIAKRLNVEPDEGEELEELQRDVEPQELLRELERRDERS